MTDHVSSPLAWIGFVHVRPAPGTTPLGEGAKGAYAHVLALARNAEGYADAVRGEMAENDLLIVELEDVAPVADYERDGRIHGELAELHAALTPACPVQYRTFDTYYSDDA